MCGGSEVHPIRPATAQGLSPRVRGKRCPRPPLSGYRRSIPACAGEAISGNEARIDNQVYPRVCGGSISLTLSTKPEMGLSPRVRGKRSQVNPFCGFVRSIPACAGEARVDNESPGVYAVYPRVCGGSTPSTNAPLSAAGLSPRVRGKPRHSRPPQKPYGSIPACAGEASVLLSPLFIVQVYPRVCGGSQRLPLFRVVAAGLSPRVRGKLPPGNEAVPDVGSIPACAGEARSSGAACWPGSVYPRVCGGSRKSGGGICRNCGLSPRVRGKPGKGGLQYHPPRSIPACAGEAPNGAGRRTSRGVYPRVCGGSAATGRRLAAGGGLSPRVRGKLAEGRDAVMDARSIPACAGEAVSV